MVHLTCLLQHRELGFGMLNLLRIGYCPEGSNCKCCDFPQITSYYVDTGVERLDMEWTAEGAHVFGFFAWHYVARRQGYPDCWIAPFIINIGIESFHAFVCI